jgi:hypothetical protein
MIKILILSAIIILATALGYLLSLNKKKRRDVYAELYEFNERLLLTLKYGQSKLCDVAKDFKYVKMLLDGQRVLDGCDGEFLQNYLFNLGKSEPSSQIDYLNERKQILKKRMEESEQDYKKYSSLYLKISLMVGILLAVLLA